jgi:hypothetical protein
MVRVVELLARDVRHFADLGQPGFDAANCVSVRMVLCA